MILAPAPMTQSNGIDDHQAALIRRYIAESRSAAQILVSDPVGWRSASDTVFSQVHLTVRKALGFAPCVGPPFDYAWYVAISGDGKYWVAGPAHTVPRYDNWLWLAEQPILGTLWARTESDYVWRHHDTGKPPQT